MNLSTYFGDFSDFMESFLLLPGRLLIVGDFNIHFENKNDSDVKKFVDILECLEFKFFSELVSYCHGVVSVCLLLNM